MLRACRASLVFLAISLNSSSLVYRSGGLDPFVDRAVERMESTYARTWVRVERTVDSAERTLDRLGHSSADDEDIERAADRAINQVERSASSLETTIDRIEASTARSLSRFSGSEDEIEELETEADRIRNDIDDETIDAINRIQMARDEAIAEN